MYKYYSNLIIIEHRWTSPVYPVLIVMKFYNIYNIYKKWNNGINVVFRNHYGKLLHFTIIIWNEVVKHNIIVQNCTNSNWIQNIEVFVYQNWSKRHV